MEKKFKCFPYTKSTFVITIEQLDPNTSPVFSGEVETNHIEQINYKGVKNVLIGSGITELHATGDHTAYLQQTIINCHKIFPRLQNIFIFYTNIYFNSDALVSKCPIKTIHLPYFLLRSTLTDLSQFTDWQIGDKKAIFLTGDIRRRIHKFPLLYYFYSKNNLNVLNYSLSSAEDLSERWNTDYLSEAHGLEDDIKLFNFVFNTTLDKEGFKNLYRSLVKNFSDDDYWRGKYNGSINFGTHIFPPAWNYSSCNLVVESTFFELSEESDKQKDYYIQKYQPDKFFFSEKIWKPILSGKPFVTISYNDSIYTQLEKLGFKTFLNYTKKPNKIRLNFSSWWSTDFSEELKIYLDVCYSRITSFIENIEANFNSIKNDVDHNKNMWKELSKNAWKEIRTACPPVRNASNLEFCEFFNANPDISFFSNWHTKE